MSGSPDADAAGSAANDVGDPALGRTLCPLVTPFADGGDAIDHDALAGVVEHVLDGGIDGLVPCGTTGEFASLADEEYCAVLETAVDAADGAPVLAGAAAPSVARTLDRIRTADAADADAALVTQPYFHTANDPAGNAAFLSRVADSAALPVYLYNIPSCTGQEIAPSVVAEVAEHPVVRGLKDSGGDFNYFLEVDRRTPDGFELYQGFDSYLVPGMFHGATGGINALSNAIPATFAAAADAVVDGDPDRARRLGTERISPLFQACAVHGFAPATKVALAARGVLDEPTVRPPLVDLDTDAAAAVRATVADAVESDN